jgi:flagellar motor switch protein FliN
VKDAKEFRDTDSLEKPVAALAAAFHSGLTARIGALFQGRGTVSSQSADAAGLGSVLQQAAGPVHVLEIRLLHDLSGTALIVMPTQDLGRLGCAILGISADGQALLSPETMEACVKFFTGVATDACEYLRRGISGTFASDEAELLNPEGDNRDLLPLVPAFQDGLRVSYRLRGSPADSIALDVLFQGQVVRALGILIARQAGAGAADTASQKWNMDLILDVELGVTVSFGETRMPLRDVLKLGVGSVIELDKGVNDPVQVIVNEKPIATGEVVMVEGNYGVKILEVESTVDRIRSLA